MFSLRYTSKYLLITLDGDTTRYPLTEESKKRVSKLKFKSYQQDSYPIVLRKSVVKFGPQTIEFSGHASQAKR
jgi:hypothetical protein